MADLQREIHQPTCLLSHHFINSLTVIIGSCDLLLERLEQSESSDPQCARRIRVIREVGAEMADELRQHECRLSNDSKVTLIRQSEPAHVDFVHQEH